MHCCELRVSCHMTSMGLPVNNSKRIKTDSLVRTSQSSSSIDSKTSLRLTALPDFTQFGTSYSRKESEGKKLCIKFNIMFAKKIKTLKVQRLSYT